MGLDHVFQEIVVKSVYGAEAAFPAFGVDGCGCGSGGGDVSSIPSSSHVVLNLGLSVILRHFRADRGKKEKNPRIKYSNGV